MGNRDKFYADVPFVKQVGEESKGDLRLKGYASTWTLDRDQEYVERTAFDGSLDRFLQKNPILLWQHQLDQPIGVVESMVLDDNGLDVECFVPRPDDKEPDWTHLAYNKIKSGIVRTFSIGGFFDRTTKGATRAITKVDLFEVSVVSVPSNPDSIFAAAVKSLEGSARPELTGAHTSQMAQLLGMKPITDPEIAMMADDEKEARYEFLAEIYRKTGKRPPAFDAWKQVLDARGKPAPERLGKVLAVMAEVDGREIAEVKQVAVPDGANQAVADAFEAVESALEDLESELENAGFDFGEPDDEGEAAGGNDGDLIQMTMMPAKAAVIRESVKSMKEALAETREVLDGKRGRVLSQANERRLRKMRDEIDQILAQIRSDSETDGEDGKATEVETPEDETLDTKAKPTNLRAGDAKAACALCVNWKAPADGADSGRAGWCKKFNYPTRANQVSDGFEAKKK